MKKAELSRIRRHVLLMLACTAGYMLMDIPVQVTRFFQFGPAVGIKNFLPPVIGIILGPAGVLGCALGCVAGGLILSTPVKMLAAECLSILICGVTAWVGWHRGNNGLSLKKPVDYLRYVILISVPAALSGVLWRLIAGPGGLSLAVACITTGLLIGIPVLILAGSIFCVEPVLPHGRKQEHHASGQIDHDPDSVGAFSDLLEEKLLLTGKVNMKRLFELQNVVEEVSLRVLSEYPDATVNVSVDCHDSCSVKFDYEGEKFSPLKMSRDGDEVDIMSIKLIRHRALRASHSFSGGVNRVHIVV